MSVLMRFVVLFILSLIMIVVAVILGDYGPWYLSWLLGTGFMILVAVMGGVLYESQEEARDNEAVENPGGPSSSGY